MATPDLSEMSIEVLADMIESNGYDAHHGFGSGVSTEKIVAELYRRMTPPPGCVRLDDGREVRFEQQYWRADTEGDSCEELEELADACEDGELLEVTPLLILPRELYVVSVNADGTASHRLATLDEVAARKAQEAAWLEKARQLPSTREAAEAVRSKQ